MSRDITIRYRLYEQNGRQHIQVKRESIPDHEEYPDLLFLTFDDPKKAEEEFREILKHPFPSDRSYNRASLIEPQTHVECAAKTDNDGQPKKYLVPSTLQTYTKRGFTILLTHGTEPASGQIWHRAALMDPNNKLVNDGYARTPWAALETLRVFTRRWFRNDNNSTVRHKEVKKNLLPDGYYESAPPGIEDSFPRVEIV